MHLMKMEKENISLKTENQSLKAMITQERNKLVSVEKRVCVREDTIDELNRKVRKQDAEIRDLQLQLNQKQQLINQKDLEKEKQRKKFTSQLAVESDMHKRKMEQKLKEQSIMQEVSRFILVMNLALPKRMFKQFWNRGKAAYFNILVEHSQFLEYLHLFYLQDKMRDNDNRIKMVKNIVTSANLDSVTPSCATDSQKTYQTPRMKTLSTPRDFPMVSSLGTTPRTHRVSTV